MSDGKVYDLEYKIQAVKFGNEIGQTKLLQSQVYLKAPCILGLRWFVQGDLIQVKDAYTKISNDTK